MTDNERAEHAANSMMRAMNSFSAGSNAKTILGKVLFEHPTLQQSFIGNIVLNAIRILACQYRNGAYDPRNEMACTICNEIWEFLKSSQWSYKVNDDEWLRLPLV